MYSEIAKFNANQKYGNYGITPLMKLTGGAGDACIFRRRISNPPPPPPLLLPAFVNASRVRARDIFWYLRSSWICFTGKLVTGFRIMTSGVLLPHSCALHASPPLPFSPRIRLHWLRRPRAGRLSNPFSKSISPHSFLPGRRRNEQFENRWTRSSEPIFNFLHPEDIGGRLQRDDYVFRRVLLTCIVSPRVRRRGWNIARGEPIRRRAVILISFKKFRRSKGRRKRKGEDFSKRKGRIGER